MNHATKLSGKCKISSERATYPDNIFKNCFHIKPYNILFWSVAPKKVGDGSGVGTTEDDIVIPT